jgi:two-component sensor histidine kinase
MLLAAAVLVPARQSAAEGEAPISSIRVVCDEDYPPFAFRDPEGRLVGIVVDQWRAWERITGTKIELSGLPWAAAIAFFEAGGADVLDTVFETPSRRERYDFTDAYASIEVPVFIHKAISGITSVEDLRGLKVGVKDGDAAIGQLVDRGVSELSLYSSYEEIVDAAVRLDLRVFCVDKPPALYWLFKRGAAEDFRIAFSLDEGAFRRAVRKGRRGLLAAVESGFSALGRSELAAIDRKWLGSEIGRSVDRRLLAISGAAALGIILILAGLSWTLRRRVAAATSELHEKVLLLESGESRIRTSLREKEILLKEIHHRVKNNLQIISSLIHLQSYALRDEADRGLFRETQQRIRAMAQLHEMLYRSPDLASIDAAEYLKAVVDGLAAGSGRRGPELSCESYRLALDEAVPLGLIANELVSNALKHAYAATMLAGGEPGSIELEFAHRGSELCLEVRDEGVGLPAGFDPLASTSMGFTLVRSLAEQLEGSLSIGGPPGLSVLLRFPERAPREPH